MGKCYLNNSAILLKFSTPWHLFSTSTFILMQKVGNFYVYCHQLNLNDLCTLHGLLSQSCIIGPCFPPSFPIFLRLRDPSDELLVVPILFDSPISIWVTFTYCCREVYISEISIWSHFFGGWNLATLGCMLYQDPKQADWKYTVR